MSRYPSAEWDPIPENKTQSKIRPTQFIFHRQVGLGDLHDWYAQQGVVVESQLWVAKSGRAKQYLDSTVRADANYLANKRPDGTGAVSCEFEGGLHNEPLTPEQVATAIRLLRDAHALDGIPLRLCTGPDEPGIGWHVMWGAPGPWTPVAKSCPTKPVIAQIPGILAAAQEDDLQFTDQINIAGTDAGKATGATSVDLGDALRRMYEWTFRADLNSAAALALAKAAAQSPRPLTAAETEAVVAKAIADNVVRVEVSVRPGDPA